MRKIYTMTFKAAATFMMLLGMSVSCSKVEFSAPVTDDESPLSFDVDWSNAVSEGEVPPQSVTVLMTRVKSLVKHYLWNLDSEGVIYSELKSESVPGGDVIPEETVPGEETVPEETLPEEVVPEEVVPEDTVPVEMLTNGTYMVAGFACGEGDVLLSNIAEFAASETLQLNDLYVEIPKLSEEEIAALDIQDLNPGIPFIRPTSHLYHVKEEDGGVRNIPSESGVRLGFDRLTCSLRLSLNLAIEEGVEVERVVGVISGLPVKAYVMSGYVDASQTGKMCFELENTDGMNDQTGLYVYSGSVVSFGIVSSTENIVSIGDGVFNGFIKARYAESEELVHEHVFNVSFNLKKMIDSSEILSSVIRKQEIYSLNVREQAFDITTKLNITKANIMSDSEGGIEEWEKDDSTDPGLNQEI